MKTKKIAPSLLSADFSILKKDIEIVEKGGADLLHIDVMDGHFVPNITMGPFIVQAIKNVSKIPLDVHLMIENPGDYTDRFIDAGADYLSVHYEACPHLHRVLQKIKSRGVKAGVALNPHTSISLIEDVMPDLDFILLMSVNPGFGGQSFIPNALNKIRKLNELLKLHNLEHIEIEIDGGIKLDNIKEVSDAGCDIFVSGSGIYRAENPTLRIEELRVELE